VSGSTGSFASPTFPPMAADARISSNANSNKTATPRSTPWSSTTSSRPGGSARPLSRARHAKVGFPLKLALTPEVKHP
jgi:hypothetical protein